MRYCFREKLEEGGRLLGTMVTTFASADLPKILARCGFDFFVVDCEHGSFTTREVADMLAVARAIGLPGVVRIPELRREHVLKFLEMGAEGLLLPNTESAEQAQQLVDWAKYAPMGHRGVSLNRPHTDFEKVDGRTYMEQSNRGTVLMAQIESREGVEHVAEIMAVDGIDLALIGPNDMSQDYGLLGQYTHPEMEAAFAQAITEAKAAIHCCPVCQNFSQGDGLCLICQDPKRDPSVICVVADPKDVAAMERSREYPGVYHVLHGVISPMNHVGPDELRVKELVNRVAEGGVSEVIMATNPDTEGEATAMYLSRLLRPFGVRVTRLAYGIPVGSHLEYADDATLMRALEGRREL